MSDQQLTTLTATGIVVAVRSRQVSRREVVEAYLDRIARINPTVNAIVELRADAALREAATADANPAGHDGLLLDGVPVSIKDHFDIEGMKHTEGIRAFADRRSPADAVPVQRLRAAGAIVIGKSNQPDFQVRWNTLNDVYGPTRNPRDPGLTVGGSSGGDAAAVAAGMAAIGLGMDAGGSIRQPAACCGIYGLRSTPGRVAYLNTAGALDNPPSLDFLGTAGPLARSVDDLALALEALHGAHPGDPVSVPVPFSRGDDGARPRIARMVRQTGASVEPAVESAVDDAARILADAGYQIVDAAPPGADRAPDLWRQLRGMELMQLVMDEWEPLLSDLGRAHIEGLFGRWRGEQPMRPYAAALVERRALARQTALWMEDHPLILAPISGRPVPPFEFDHFLSGDAMESLFAAHRNIVWVNCLGLPAVAIPSGVQLIARRFREDEALAAARILERSLGPCTIAGAEA